MLVLANLRPFYIERVLANRCFGFGISGLCVKFERPGAVEGSLLDRHSRSQIPSAAFSPFININIPLHQDLLKCRCMLPSVIDRFN